MSALAFDSEGFYEEVYTKAETPQTFSGPGEPSATLGKIGDIYIKLEETN